MIVVLVGPSCAGKTTAGEYLASATGAPLYEASDYVHERHERSRHDGPVLRFAEELFAEEGHGVVARWLTEDLSTAGDGGRAVVAGFRTVEEVAVLRETFEDVLVVGVHADASVRYDRCRRRERQGDPQSYPEFLRKDFAEYGLGIASLLSDEADLLLENDGTVEAFHERLDARVLPELRR